ncbi:MAG: hypothetical protein Kow0083_03170 [Methylophaga sp.]
MALNIMNSLKPDERERIRQGLGLIKYIQKVIVLAQQHRGMSNTVMQGNESLKPELMAVQTALNHLISAKSEPNLKPFPEWKSVVKGWPELREHSLSGEWQVHTLFRQHNILIARLLTLLDDITRHYELQVIMLDRVTHALSVCLHTLKVAETIAQVRGVGSGICASGVVDDSDKLILDYLRNVVVEASDELFNELRQIASPFLKKQLAMSCQAIRESLNRLLAVIDNQVLNEGETSITAKQFFSTATTPIDGLLVIFNLIVNMIAEQYAIAV